MSETALATIAVQNMARAIEPYLRYLQNHARAATLFHAAKLQETTLRSNMERSALVFLHAAFEDFLGNMNRPVLLAGDGILADVPFVGEPGSRSTKMTLADLRKHKSKSVADLIEESVDSYLSKLTFNNRGDVSKYFITTLGFPKDPFEPFLADIDALMRRRHLVVHTADLGPIADDESPCWTAAESRALDQWGYSTLGFVVEVALLQCDKASLTGSIARIATRFLTGARNHLSKARCLADGRRNGSPTERLNAQETTIKLTTYLIESARTLAKMKSLDLNGTLAGILPPPPSITVSQVLAIIAESKNGEGCKLPRDGPEDK